MGLSSSKCFKLNRKKERDRSERERERERGASSHFPPHLWTWTHRHIHFHSFSGIFLLFFSFFLFFLSDLLLLLFLNNCFFYYYYRSNALLFLYSGFALSLRIKLRKWIGIGVFYDFFSLFFFLVPEICGEEVWWSWLSGGILFYPMNFVFGFWENLGKWMRMGNFGSFLFWAALIPERYVLYVCWSRMGGKLGLYYITGDAW